MKKANEWSDNWVEFYKEKRIRAQLDLIRKNHPSDNELLKLGIH